MWWCCGKKSREAKGCKYAKHTNNSKRDEDSDEDYDETLEKYCVCCNKRGHFAKECLADPNFRYKCGGLTPGLEMDRILRLLRDNTLTDKSQNHLATVNLLKNGIERADGS